MCVCVVCLMPSVGGQSVRGDSVVFGSYGSFVIRNIRSVKFSGCASHTSTVVVAVMSALSLFSPRFGCLCGGDLHILEGALPQCGGGDLHTNFCQRQIPLFTYIPGIFVDGILKSIGHCLFLAARVGRAHSRVGRSVVREKINKHVE